MPTLDELKQTTIGQIDEMFNRVKKEILRNGYLDHEIRAIEDLKIKELKAEEKELAKRENRSPNPVHYKIHKHPYENFGLGQGTVYLFKNGMEMRYSPKGNRLHILIAIAHELGHGILGHLELADVGNSQVIKNDALEAQASYFARKSVEYRSNQYQDDEYLTSHYFTEETILEAISRIHSGYNEKLIPSVVKRMKARVE